jgi:hypothetical protein
MVWRDKIDMVYTKSWNAERVSQKIRVKAITTWEAGPPLDNCSPKQTLSAFAEESIETSTVTYALVFPSPCLISTMTSILRS